MRILLVVPGILLAVAAFGGRADAQNYPWCAHYDVADEALNCGFVTEEQCQATVRGIGGFCAPNNTYRAYTPSAPPRGGHRHRHDKNA